MIVSVLHYHRHTHSFDVVFKCFRIQRTFTLIYFSPQVLYCVSYLTTDASANSTQHILSYQILLWLIDTVTTSTKHFEVSVPLLPKKRKKKKELKVGGEVILNLFVPPAAISGDLRRCVSVCTNSRTTFGL